MPDLASFASTPATCYPPSRLPLVVVFHVCAADIGLALRHAEWMKKAGCRHGHQAILACDDSLQHPDTGRLACLLGNIFGQVDLHVYSAPKTKAWPQAPNHAWQSVARHMSGQRHPWLWMEADAVVLKPAWLEILQHRYNQSGRRYMGPRVEGHGHINGCAIYPPDAARRLTAAMNATTIAWDFAAKEQMTPTEAHDAGDLMLHWWMLNNGKPHATTGKEPPQKITAQQARAWIPKQAVMVHRVKDSSLVNLLIEGKYAHDA